MARERQGESAFVVAQPDPGWEALTRRAAYLETISTASDDAIFRVDPDGTVAEWNRGAARITGYRADEIVGRPAGVLLPEWQPLLDRALAGETVDHASIELRRSDAGIVPVALTLSPIMTDGGVTGVAVIARDVSEQQFAMQTLLESAERMAENEALAQAGTWAWDAEADAMQWSAEMHRLHAVPPDHFRGDRLAHLEAVDPSDRERVGARLAASFEQGIGVEDEYRVQLPDGDGHWIYLRGEPVRDQNGLTVGLRGICQDVTARREVENAVRRALDRERAAAEELRAADRLKDEFLAIVSHELRTPLTAIAGFAGLLSANPNVPTELIAPVVRNAREMEGMVERLLDFTRLEAQRVDVQARQVMLADEVSRCVSRLEPLLADHRVRVEVPAALAVAADRELFGHVLSNLLGNAVKYAPAGTAITIEAHRDGAAVAISVADQGRGVPVELQQRVFERFIQGPDQPNGKRGSGIGLSIVSRCTTLMGGTVACADAPGGGAVFTFTLPVA